MKRERPDLEALSAWIEERCEPAAEHMDFARQLFKSWKHFATLAGVQVGTPRSFSNELRKRGYPSERLSPERRTRIHRGLRTKYMPIGPEVPAFAIPYLRPPRPTRSFRSHARRMA